ncbi:MAG: polysaccharide export protein [Gemmataceae bacterium]|nr:polysaccharide export protein [Gemmataceae bacterium]
MQARRAGHGIAAMMGFLLVCVAGCAVGAGGRSMFSSGGNKLLPTVKEVAQPHPVPLPRELDKQALAPYIVEPGDVLVIHPADLDSPVRLPGDQPILPDGTINLGRYGHLSVVGKTVEEIEMMVRAAVEIQTKDVGFITVRLVSRASKVYYVLGEVNAPGAFPLTGRETVLDGIIAAGGLNDRASRRNIIMTRPTAPDSCRVVLPICLREIVQLGDTTTNYQLAPGDRIFVPTRSCWEDFSLNGKQDSWSCGKLQIPCPVPAPPCEAPH